MKLFFTFILLMITTPSFSDDHLEPEESHFSNMFLFEYYEMVLEAYSETYDENFLIRAIVLPSFTPEYAIAIKKVNNKFRVVHLQTTAQFWTKFMEGTTEKDYKIDRCEKEIDGELTNKILSLWETMLLGTRCQNYNGDYTIGLDGTTYHFSMKVPNRPGVTMAGNTWSPQKDSATGLLVGISDDLVTFCADKNGSLNSIEAKIVELQNKIKLGETNLGQ